MPQHQLYTLPVRAADETGRARQRLQVMAAVTEVLVAPEQPGAVLARIAAADMRIVSLTITEKGYCHDPASGRLRLDHPDIVHDLATADSPRSHRLQRAGPGAAPRFGGGAADADVAGQPAGKW